MATTLAYTPGTYDSLPLLRAAHAAFEEKDASNYLHGDILALFQRYPEVGQNFGLQLLHRHFPMDSDEILVEVDRTSVPWHVKNLGEGGTIMQGRVVPRSFRFKPDSDGVEPYEFRYMPNDEAPLADPNDKQYAAFMEELSATLKKHDLGGVLGINCLVPEIKPPQGSVDQRKWLWEKTIGRANILFPMSKLGKNSIASIFTFGGGPDAIGMSAQCTYPCVCKHPGADEFGEDSE